MFRETPAELGLHRTGQVQRTPASARGRASSLGKVVTCSHSSVVRTRPPALAVSQHERRWCIAGRDRSGHDRPANSRAQCVVGGPVATAWLTKRASATCLEKFTNRRMQQRDTPRRDADTKELDLAPERPLGAADVARRGRYTASKKITSLTNITRESESVGARPVHLVSNCVRLLQSNTQGVS